jgi:hypothetical protein
MKCSRIFVSLAGAIAAIAIPFAAHADTIKARCDVYPKGEDRAVFTGNCSFSQRQGAVGIELENGQRYDLRPKGNQPGNYVDPQGRAAYRENGLGDMGEIYRLANESVFVYWVATQYKPTPPKNTASRPTIAPKRRGVSRLTATDPEAHINVRSQSTINSTSPYYGLPGDAVEVLRCVQDKDTAGSDLNWCNVEFVRSRATGWVRSDFIVFADGGE